MMLRVSAVALLLLATALTSACGTVSRRDLPYQGARNQPPLEVPSDLDRPVSDETLRIPEVRGTASATAAARQGSQAAVNALVLADSPASAWRRVGLALERMGGDVQVLQTDEPAGRYRVSMSGTRPAQGTIRRLLRRDQRVQEQFDLIVEPAATGTTVRAEGGAALARELLQRLSRRLG